MKCLAEPIWIFLGILLILSCQPQRNVVGKYAAVHRREYPKIVPATFYIELDSDSTFTYLYHAGFHKKVSAGIWKAEKDNKRIIVNSFIQDIRNIPIFVVETRNNNYSYSLFVFDNPMELDSLVRWTLKVNDIDYPLNTDSLVLNEKIIVDSFCLTGHITSIDSMYIIPIPLQDTIRSKKYKVKNLNNNIYRIAFPKFVSFDIFNYKPLQGSLKLSGKTLLFEEIKLKKE